MQRTVDTVNHRLRIERTSQLQIGRCGLFSIQVGCKLDGVVCLLMWYGAVLALIDFTLSVRVGCKSDEVVVYSNLSLLIFNDVVRGSCVAL